MRLRTWLLLTALLTMVLSAHSQTCNNHTVTATITDGNSQVWQNGTFTVSLYNPSGGQRPVCRNTGVAITTNYSGSMNSSGVISVSLPDTSAIDPGGTQWVFVISPNAGPQTPSLMAPVGVTANVDLSSTFTPQLTLISIPKCNHTCYGYNTNEVTAPVAGDIFMNTTVGANPACNTWSGSTWLNCSGVGSQTITIGSGAPSGGCTSLANVGSLYVDRNVIQTVSIGPALYVCAAVAGPTFVWSPMNNWGGTGTTNSPGANANWACISNASPPNTCTWQALSTVTGLPVLGSNGAPTAPCNTTVNGQQDNDYTNSIGYICQGATISTGTWIQSTWQGVTATNTPGTGINQACISNATNNHCTWQLVPNTTTPLFNAYQTASFGSTPTSVVTTPSTTVVASQLLIVFCATGSTGSLTTAVTDTLGNTWFARTQAQVLGGENISGQTFWAIAASTGTDAFTCTNTPAEPFISVIAMQWTKVAASFADAGSSIVQQGADAFGVNNSAYATTQRTIDILCARVNSGSGSFASDGVSGSGGTIIAVGSTQFNSNVNDAGCLVAYPPNPDSVKFGAMHYYTYPNGSLTTLAWAGNLSSWYY